jgi:hypothetical protein
MVVTRWFHRGDDLFIQNIAPNKMHSFLGAIGGAANRTRTCDPVITNDGSGCRTVWLGREDSNLDMAD